MIQVQIDPSNQADNVKALVPLDTDALSKIDFALCELRDHAQPDQAPYKADLEALRLTIRHAWLALDRVEQQLPNRMGGRRDYYEGNHGHPD
jgi:hypothetical protein